MSKPGERNSGNLAHDAPALLTALGRLFTADERVQFETLYRAVHAAGGLYEGPIERKSTSFNPRPARLCKILMRETQETSFDVLAAAMLLGVSKPITVDKSFECAQRLAGEVRSASQSTAKPSVAVERLHLAELLDDLRHLHMSTHSLEEKEQQPKRFEAHYGNGPQHSENEPLVRAAREAVERVRTLLLRGDVS